MSNEQPLVNRVAASGLITIKLEEFLPDAEFAEFDLKDYLFQGLILREKDFREAVRDHDWTLYRGKILLTFCSTDAIIPVWAYMLVTASAAPYAADIFQGNRSAYFDAFFREKLATLDIEAYTGQRIVIKGCSDRPVPVSAYVELTRRLRPFARSIMYGEPCSTVPIYKKPRD